jgi:hypothetical protein
VNSNSKHELFASDVWSALCAKYLPSDREAHAAASRELQAAQLEYRAARIQLTRARRKLRGVLRGLNYAHELNVKEPNLSGAKA